MTTRSAKIFLIILPIVFTAQSCDFLFGDLTSSGSGIRGVLWSVDSGDTWEAGKSGENQGLSNASIAALFIEEGMAENLLAASIDQGVFASEDRGKNWGLLLPNFVAYDVFINPSDGNLIYAAGAKDKIGSILKSSDRGGSWVQIYTEPASKVFVAALGFDPVNPRTVFAGLSTGTMIRSTDSGETWNKLTEFQDRVLEIVGRRGLVYVLTSRTGLHKSTDGGRTWTTSSTPQGISNFNDLFVEQNK